MDYIAFTFIISNAILLLSVVMLLIQSFVEEKNATIFETYPKVHIIVPFFNEPPEILLNTLAAIERLNYPSHLQVFLVDDGSTNHSPLVIKNWLKEPRNKKYSHIVLPTNSGSKGKAMDHALAEVQVEKPDVVGVIDSDTYLQPDALLKAVGTLYSKESNAAVCGFVVPVKSSSSTLCQLQYLEHIGSFAAIKHAQKQLGMVSVMAGAFTLHKADAIEKLGGWGDWLVEDIAWTWKARVSGYTTDYAFDALAHTICPASTKTLFKQRTRWARGRIEALKVAWGISKLKTLALLPWQFVNFQFTVAPAILLLPIALYFDCSLFSIGLISLNIVLQALLVIHTFFQQKQSLELCVKQLPLCLFVNSVVNFLFLPAIAKGVFSEMLNQKHTWLTRE